MELKCSHLCFLKFVLKICIKVIGSSIEHEGRQIRINSFFTPRWVSPPPFVLLINPLQGRGTVFPALFREIPYLPQFMSGGLKTNEKKRHAAPLLWINATHVFMRQHTKSFNYLAGSISKSFYTVSPHTTSPSPCLLICVRHQRRCTALYNMPAFLQSRGEIMAGD